MCSDEYTDDIRMSPATQDSYKPGAIIEAESDTAIFPIARQDGNVTLRQLSISPEADRPYC